MSVMPTSYTIPSKELNTLLKLRIPTVPALQALINDAGKLIEEHKSLDEIKELIVRRMLFDDNEFFSFLPEKDSDEESRAQAIGYAYEAIIIPYHVLDLQNICADLNAKKCIKYNRSVARKVAQRKKKKKVESTRAVTPREAMDIVEKKIASTVIGQKEAIEDTMKIVKLLVSDLYDRGSIFFIGPTGCGKTLLAKSVGEIFSNNFKKFNCAEFTNEGDKNRYLGAPPGYVGHRDKSIFKQMSEKSNKWVFLFDEIEKAGPKFHEFLLALLDDGYVEDNNGETINFSKSLFIFTSNQGMADLKTGNKLGFKSGQYAYEESREEILKSIQDKFAPEFFNRIDKFTFFNVLSKEDVKQIAKLELEPLPIEISEELVTYISEKAFSKEFGGRNINRFIRDNIAILVAEELINRNVSVDSDFYTISFVSGIPTILNTKPLANSMPS